MCFVSIIGLLINLSLVVIALSALRGCSINTNFSDGKGGWGQMLKLADRGGGGLANGDI